MLFKIKNDIHWGIWILNKPVLVVKKYYNMLCQYLKDWNIIPVPEDMTFVSINESNVLWCEQPGLHTVKFMNANTEKGFLGLIAVRGEGQIVGFICGADCRTDWQYSDIDDTFYIKYVFVFPEYRGNRYTGILIREVTARAGKKFLMLNVRTNNNVAIRAYEIIGFRSMSVEKIVRIPIFRKTVSHQVKEIHSEKQCISEQ